MLVVFFDYVSVLDHVILFLDLPCSYFASMLMSIDEIGRTVNECAE